MGRDVVGVRGVVSSLRTGRPNRSRCLRTIGRMLLSVRSVCGLRPRFRGTGVVRELIRPSHVFAFHMA